jgi:hypothetical protein
LCDESAGSFQGARGREKQLVVRRIGILVLVAEQEYGPGVFLHVAALHRPHPHHFHENVGDLRELLVVAHHRDVEEDDGAILAHFRDKVGGCLKEIA